MTSHARIEIPCASPAEAERLRAALHPDNQGMLETSTKGALLILEATAATPMSLLRTVDDALACLRATGMP